MTTLVGYNQEEMVARTTIDVPVSAHPIEAVNLKEPGLGLYDQLAGSSPGTASRRAASGSSSRRTNSTRA